MVNKVSACGFPARMPRELTFETMSAKEAKNRFDCSGNHLGYSNEADRGLQCGLSGNSVPNMVNISARTLMGNPLTATRGSPRGKPTEPQAARFTRSAVTYLNKETVKAVIKATPLCGIVYTLRRRNFAVCRNFLLLWNKSGAKSVKELSSVDTTDKQKKNRRKSPRLLIPHGSA